MNLKNTLLNSYEHRLGALPPERQAAIANAVQCKHLVVASYDPETGTTIATLTGNVNERLWHVAMTSVEANAIGEALTDFLNMQDDELQLAVAAALETGGRVLLSLTMSAAAHELRVMLAVDGVVRPLAAWTDPVVH